MNRRMIVRWLPIFLIIIVSMGCDDSQNSEEQNKPVKEMSSEPKIVVPVEAMIVKTKSVEQTVPLTGVFQPLHSADIVAEGSGKIEKVYKQLGAYVSTRDTLAVIDDIIPLSQFRQAQSQVISAENNLEIAKTNLKSDEVLLKNGDISQLEYDNSVLTAKTAEASKLSALANLSVAKKAYEDTRIKSPINGYVSRKHVDIGTMVNPGMVTYRVVDLSKMKLEIGIPQEFINRVRSSSQANITVSALRNETFKGKVKYMSPQADESTGSFLIEIHVNNTKDVRIRAGMTARVELILSNLEEQLVIPDHALVSKNGNNNVYKISNGKARLHNISVAEIVGPNVILNGGLAEGDTIVVVGMDNLGIETPVQIESVH